MRFRATAQGNVPFTPEEEAEQDAIDAAYALTKQANDKALMWERIKEYRDNRIQNGGYKVGAHWFHSDTFSRTQQLALVIMGAGMPAGIQWKTMDNGYVPMTPTLAGQIFAAGAASDAAIFTKAVDHKTAMEASSNPLSYDYTTGWPVIFGEPES